MSAPTLVQHTGLYSGSSKAFTSNVTAGNLLLVLYQLASISTDSNSINANGISDSRGNTWTTFAFFKDAPGDNNTPPAIAQWGYYAIAKDSGACTVTITPGRNADPGIFISEWSGQDATPVGTPQYSTGNSAGTTFTAPAITTAGDAVIVGFIGQEITVETLTAGSGWTQLERGSGQESIVVYKSVTGISTATPTVTASISQKWAGLSFEIRGAGAGAGFDPTTATAGIQQPPQIPDPEEEPVAYA